jgi:hypothetical protein
MNLKNSEMKERKKSMLNPSRIQERVTSNLTRFERILFKLRLVRTYHYHLIVEVVSSKISYEGIVQTPINWGKTYTYFTAKEATFDHIPNGCRGTLVSLNKI